MGDRCLTAKFRMLGHAGEKTYTENLTPSASHDLKTTEITFNWKSFTCIILDFGGYLELLLTSMSSVDATHP